MIIAENIQKYKRYMYDGWHHWSILVSGLSKATTAELTQCSLSVVTTLIYAEVLYISKTGRASATEQHLDDGHSGQSGTN